jgi:hypothetical protein
LTIEKNFVPPPVELIERWIFESNTKPSMQSAFNYVAHKAAEWGFNVAMEPDPSSLKQQALKGLERIQRIDVVSVWIGRDVFDVIRSALNKLPNNI